MEAMFAMRQPQMTLGFYPYPGYGPQAPPPGYPPQVYGSPTGQTPPAIGPPPSAKSPFGWGQL
jgi:hypothetical protein